MSNVQTLPLRLLAQRLTIQIELAEWVFAAELSQFAKRLGAYTTAIGLKPDVGRSTIHILAGRRRPSLLDRGVILDWLVAQHEIVDIAVNPADPGSSDFLSIVLGSTDSSWPVFKAGR